MLDFEARALAIKAAKGGGGGEPAEYLKRAEVDGNTLTLTKKDGDTVVFSPSGAGETQFTITGNVEQSTETGKHSVTITSPNLYSDIRNFVDTNNKYPTVKATLFFGYGEAGRAEFNIPCSVFTYNFGSIGTMSVEGECDVDALSLSKLYGKSINAASPGTLKYKFSVVLTPTSQEKGLLEVVRLQAELTAGNNITIENNRISANLDKKQDKLTPGTNITIDENNVISADIKLPTNHVTTDGDGQVISGIKKFTTPLHTIFSNSICVGESVTKGTLYGREDITWSSDASNAFELKFPTSHGTLAISEDYIANPDGSATETLNRLKIKDIIYSIPTADLSEYATKEWVSENYVSDIELKTVADMAKEAKDLAETKQDKLTAGENITIENNVISATGSITPTNMVTTDTAQEISGKKTFTKYIRLLNEQTREEGKWTSYQDNEIQRVNNYQPLYTYNFPNKTGTFALNEDLQWEAGEGENSAVLKGSNSFARGKLSVAEGQKTDAVAEGSHAEGLGTMAGGEYSHAEGVGTLTNNRGEHAEGIGNKSNPDSEMGGNGTIHSVGIGNPDDPRNHKNAFEILKDGSTYLYGVGNYDGTNINEAETLQTVILESKHGIDVIELTTVAGTLTDADYNKIAADPNKVVIKYTPQNLTLYFARETTGTAGQYLYSGMVDSGGTSEAFTTTLQIMKSTKRYMASNKKLEYNDNKKTQWSTTPNDVGYPSEKLVKDSLNTLASQIPTTYLVDLEQDDASIIFHKSNGETFEYIVREGYENGHIILGNFDVVVYNDTEIKNTINAKQDKLTAGTNITIDENNVISAMGGGVSDVKVNHTSVVTDGVANINNMVTTNTVQTITGNKVFDSADAPIYFKQLIHIGPEEQYATSYDKENITYTLDNAHERVLSFPDKSGTVATVDDITSYHDSTKQDKTEEILLTSISGTLDEATFNKISSNPSKYIINLGNEYYFPFSYQITTFFAYGLLSDRLHLELQISKSTRAYQVVQTRFVEQAEALSLLNELRNSKVTDDTYENNNSTRLDLLNKVSGEDNRTINGIATFTQEESPTGTIIPFFFILRKSKVFNTVVASIIVQPLSSTNTNIYTSYYFRDSWKDWVKQTTQADIDTKQDKLTAGTNITIDENNVISATSVAPRNMVTTDTVQTITGNKVFDSADIPIYFKQLIHIGPEEQYATSYDKENIKYTLDNVNERVLSFPNKSGTIAVTNDIPTITENVSTGIITIS